MFVHCICQLVSTAIFLAKNMGSPCVRSDIPNCHTPKIDDLIFGVNICCGVSVGNIIHIEISTPLNTFPFKNHSLL